MQPLNAGLALLPMSAASFVVAGTFGRRVHTIPPRYTIGFGLVVIGIGALLLHTGSSWVAILPGMAVAGVGVGVIGQALPGAMMSAVPHDRAGMASGALNTFRQLGFAFGVAVLGTVVRGGEDFSAGLENSYLVAGISGIVVGVLAFALIRSRKAVDDAKPDEVLRAEV
jgi:MFS family permease